MEAELAPAELAPAQLASAQLASAELASAQIASAQLASAQLASAQLASAQIACERDRRITRDYEDTTRKSIRDEEDTKRKRKREAEDMDWAWWHRVTHDQRRAHVLRYQDVTVCHSIVWMLYGNRRPSGLDLLSLKHEAGEDYVGLHKINPERCTVPLEQLYLAVAAARDLMAKEPEMWRTGQVVFETLDLMIDGRVKRLSVCLHARKRSDPVILVEPCA
jgi:hypothetical protein